MELLLLSSFHQDVPSAICHEGRAHFRAAFMCFQTESVG